MRFVTIIHYPEWNESRLTDVLCARGHTVEYRCHRFGDKLPAVDEFDGVVIGGGDVSVWEAETEPFMAREIAFARDVVDSGRPYFGICLGAQILAAAFGATSGGRPDGAAEFGFFPIEATAAGEDLFRGLDRVYQVHWEAVTELPEGATHLASSDRFENQAFSIGDNAIGVQFHPDARADMIEHWWHDNESIKARPGVQPLAEQLADAERFEEQRAAWLERVVDRWLGVGVGAGTG